MDFSVLIADLRDVAEKYKGKTTEPQVSTLAYVDMFTKILKRAQKVTDDYGDQIQVLWVALNQLAAIYKDLSLGQARDNLCRFIFGMCARTVLNIQWSQLDDDSKSKKNLCSAVENVHKILSELGFDRFQLILDLMESHWTHPVLSQIMSSDEDDIEGGFDYIQQEDPDILKLRIEIMMKENCEEFALNLCHWSLQHPALTNDLKIKEQQIFMLYKQGEYGKMQEVCESIVCHDGIKVMSHLAKVPTNQSLCIRLAQVFLIHDWVKSDRNCCTQELLKLWIHHQYLADKDEERFLDSIWTVAKVSRDTEQIGVLIEGVRKECGDMFIQLYTELCKYALNIDKGNMEIEEKQENQEEVNIRKIRISKTCVRMAFMLKEYDFRMSRISGLTAFALAPTSENLNLVNKLYWTIKNTSAVAANSKVNPATLYEVERLLGLMRPEMLNPDYSWKQLIPICKRYRLDTSKDDPSMLAEEELNVRDSETAGSSANPNVPSVFSASDMFKQQQQQALMSEAKKPIKRQASKKNIEKDIEKSHVERMLQSRNLSKEQIEKILSDQFPRNALKDLSEGPPLSMKQLDKTIDDLKKSIYKETQCREALEKKFSTFSQAKRTAELKTKGQEHVSRQDQFQQGVLYARQHSLPSDSTVTQASMLHRQMSQGSSVPPRAHSQQGHLSSPIGTAGAPPSAHQTANRISSPGFYQSQPQATGRTQSASPASGARVNTVQQPSSHTTHQGHGTIPSQSSHIPGISPSQVKGHYGSPTGLQSGQAHMHGGQKLQRTISHPNILRPADSSQQECAKIAQHIAEMHERQRKEKERIEKIRMQGRIDGTKIALNSRSVPNSNQISELLSMTIKGGKSVSLQQFQKELSSSNMCLNPNEPVKKEYEVKNVQHQSGISQERKVPNTPTAGPSVKPSVEAEARTKNMETHKYYLTTGKAMNQLKRDTTGNINLGSSKFSIKPVFSMKVPKSMTRPDKKEELVKTVTSMVKQASNTPVSIQPKSFPQMHRQQIPHQAAPSNPAANSVMSTGTVQSNSYGTMTAMNQSGQSNTQYAGIQQMNANIVQQANIAQQASTDTLNVTPGSFIQPLLQNVSQGQLLPAENVVLSPSMQSVNLAQAPSAMPLHQPAVNQTLDFSQLDLQNLNTLANASLSIIGQTNNQTISGLENVQQEQLQPVQHYYGSGVVETQQMTVAEPQIIQQDTIMATPLFTCTSTGFSQQSFASTQQPFLNTGHVLNNQQQQHQVLNNQQLQQQQHQVLNNQQQLQQQQQQQMLITPQSSITVQQPEIHQLVSIQNLQMPDFPQSHTSVQSSVAMNQTQMGTIPSQISSSLPGMNQILNTYQGSNQEQIYHQTQQQRTSGVETVMSETSSAGEAGRVAQSQFLAAPELSPAVVQQILSSLKRSTTHPKPATQCEIPSTSSHVKMANSTSTVADNRNNEVDSKFKESEATIRENLKQFLMKKDDPNVKQSILEATQKIMQLRKQYKQYTSSENSGPSSLQTFQMGNKGGLLKHMMETDDDLKTMIQQGKCKEMTQKSTSVIKATTLDSQTVPDLPDLGASEIDSILGSVGESEFATMQEESSKRKALIQSHSEVTRQVTGNFHMNSQQSGLSHHQSTVNVKSTEVLPYKGKMPLHGSSTEKQNFQGSQGGNVMERNVQSTYLNANRIAKEREEKTQHSGMTVIQQHSNAPVQCKESRGGPVPAQNCSCMLYKEHLNAPIDKKHCNCSDIKILPQQIPSDQVLKNNEMVACGICFKKFNSLSAIKDHVKKSCTSPSSVAAKSVPLKDFEYSVTYKCTNCNFMNGNEKISTKHVENCSSNVTSSPVKAQLITLYKCRMCSDMFSDKQSTYRHVSKLCPKLKVVSTHRDVQDNYQKLKSANKLQVPASGEMQSSSRLGIGEQKQPNYSGTKQSSEKTKFEILAKTDSNAEKTMLVNKIIEDSCKTSSFKIPKAGDTMSVGATIRGNKLQHNLTRENQEYSIPKTVRKDTSFLKSEEGSDVIANNEKTKTDHSNEREIEIESKKVRMRDKSDGDRADIQTDGVKRKKLKTELKENLDMTTMALNGDLEETTTVLKENKEKHDNSSDDSMNRNYYRPKPRWRGKDYDKRLREKRIIKKQKFLIQEMGNQVQDKKKVEKLPSNIELTEDGNAEEVDPEKMSWWLRNTDAPKGLHGYPFTCYLCDYECKDGYHNSFIKHFVQRHYLGCKLDKHGYSCRYCGATFTEFLRKPVTSHIIYEHKEHLFRLIVEGNLLEESLAFVTKSTYLKDNCQKQAKAGIQRSGASSEKMSKHLKAVAMRKRCAENLKKIANQRASVDRETSGEESDRDTTEITEDSGSDISGLRKLRKVDHNKVMENKDENTVSDGSEVSYGDVKNDSLRHRSRSSSLSSQSSRSEMGSILKSLRSRNRKSKQISKSDERKKLMLTRSGRTIRKIETDSSSVSETSDENEDYEGEEDTDDDSEHIKTATVERRRSLRSRRLSEKGNISQKEVESSNESSAEEVLQRVTRSASLKTVDFRRESNVCIDQGEEHFKTQSGILSIQSVVDHKNISHQTTKTKENKTTDLTHKKYDLRVKEKLTENDEVAEHLHMMVNSIVETEMKLLNANEVERINKDVIPRSDNDSISDSSQSQKVYGLERRSGVMKDKDKEGSNADNVVDGKINSSENIENKSGSDQKISNDKVMQKNLSVLIGPDEDFSDLDTLPLFNKVNTARTEKSPVNTPVPSTGDTQEKVISNVNPKAVMESDDEFLGLQSIQATESANDMKMNRDLKDKAEEGKAFDSEFMKFAQNRNEEKVTECEKDTSNECSRDERLQSDVDISTKPAETSFGSAFMKFAEILCGPARKVSKMSKTNNPKDFSSAFESFAMKSEDKKTAKTAQVCSNEKHIRNSSHQKAISDTNSDDTSDYDAFAVIDTDTKYQSYKEMYSLTECSVRIQRLDHRKLQNLSLKYDKSVKDKKVVINDEGQVTVILVKDPDTPEAELSKVVIANDEQRSQHGEGVSEEVSNVLEIDNFQIQIEENQLNSTDNENMEIPKAVVCYDKKYPVVLVTPLEKQLSDVEFMGESFEEEQAANTENGITQIELSTYKNAKPVTYSDSESFIDSERVLSETENNDVPDEYSNTLEIEVQMDKQDVEDLDNATSKHSTETATVINIEESYSQESKTAQVVGHSETHLDIGDEGIMEGTRILSEQEVEAEPCVDRKEDDYEIKQSYGSTDTSTTELDIDISETANVDQMYKRPIDAREWNRRGDGDGISMTNSKLFVSTPNIEEKALSEEDKVENNLSKVNENNKITTKHLCEEAVKEQYVIGRFKKEVEGENNPAMEDVTRSVQVRKEIFSVPKCVMGECKAETKIESGVNVGLNSTGTRVSQENKESTNTPNKSSESTAALASFMEDVDEYSQMEDLSENVIGKVNSTSCERQIEEIRNTCKSSDAVAVESCSSKTDKSQFSEASRNLSNSKACENISVVSNQVKDEIERVEVISDHFDIQTYDNAEISDSDIEPIEIGKHSHDFIDADDECEFLSANDCEIVQSESVKVIEPSQPKKNEENSATIQFHEPPNIAKISDQSETELNNLEANHISDKSETARTREQRHTTKTSKDSGTSQTREQLDKAKTSKDSGTTQTREQLAAAKTSKDSGTTQTREQLAAAKTSKDSGTTQNREQLDTAKSSKDSGTTQNREQLNITETSKHSETTHTSEGLEIALESEKSRLTHANEQSETICTRELLETTQTCYQSEATQVKEQSKLSKTKEQSETISTSEVLETPQIKDKSGNTYTSDKLRVIQAKTKSKLTHVTGQLESTHFDLSVKPKSSDQSEKTQIIDKSENTQLIDQSENIHISEQPEETQISEQYGRIQVTELTDNTQINVQLEKTQTSEQPEETELMERSEETPITEQSEKTYTTEQTEKTNINEQSEKTDIIEHSEETPISEQSEKMQINEQSDKTQVSEQSEKIQINSQSEKTQIRDKSGKTLFSNQLETEIDNNAEVMKIIDQSVSTQTIDQSATTYTSGHSKSAHTIEHSDKTQAREQSKYTETDDSSDFKQYIIDKSETTHIGEQSGNPPVSEQSDNALVSEPLDSTQTDMPTESIQIIELSQSSPVNDQSENTQISIKPKLAQVYCQVQKTMISDQSEKTQVSEHSRKEQMCDQSLSTQISSLSEKKHTSDHIKKTQINDQLEEKQINDHIKKTQFIDYPKEIQIHNQSEKAHVNEQSDMEQISDHSEKTQICNQSEDTCVSVFSEDKQTNDQSEETQISDQSEKIQISYQSEKKKISAHSEETQTSNQSEKTEISDQSEDIQINDLSEETHIGDLSEETHISDHSEKEQIIDHSENTPFSNHSEKEQIHDHSEKTEICGNSGNTQINNQSVKEHISDISEKTQICDHSEKIEIIIHSEETQITDHSKKTQASDDSEKTRVSNQSERIQLDIMSEIIPTNEQSEIKQTPEQSEIAHICDQSETTPVAEPFQTTHTSEQLDTTQASNWSVTKQGGDKETCELVSDETCLSENYQKSKVFAIAQPCDVINMDGVCKLEVKESNEDEVKIEVDPNNCSQIEEIHCFGASDMEQSQTSENHENLPNLGISENNGTVETKTEIKADAILEAESEFLTEEATCYSGYHGVSMDNLKNNHNGEVVKKYSDETKALETENVSDTYLTVDNTDTLSNVSSENISLISLDSICVKEVAEDSGVIENRVSLKPDEESISLPIEEVCLLKTHDKDSERKVKKGENEQEKDLLNDHTRMITGCNSTEEEFVCKDIATCKSPMLLRIDDNLHDNVAVELSAESSSTDLVQYLTAKGPEHVLSENIDCLFSDRGERCRDTDQSLNVTTEQNKTFSQEDRKVCESEKAHEILGHQGAEVDETESIDNTLNVRKTNQFMCLQKNRNMDGSMYENIEVTDGRVVKLDSMKQLVLGENEGKGDGNFENVTVEGDIKEAMLEKETDGSVKSLEQYTADKDTSSNTVSIKKTSNSDSVVTDSKGQPSSDAVSGFALQENKKMPPYVALKSVEKLETIVRRMIDHTAGTKGDVDAQTNKEKYFSREDNVQTEVFERTNKSVSKKVLLESTLTDFEKSDKTSGTMASPETTTNEHSNCIVEETVKKEIDGVIDDGVNQVLHAITNDSVDENVNSALQNILTKIYKTVDQKRNDEDISYPKAQLHNKTETEKSNKAVEAQDNAEMEKATISREDKLQNKETNETLFKLEDKSQTICFFNSTENVAPPKAVVEKVEELVSKTIDSLNRKEIIMPLVTYEKQKQNKRKKATEGIQLTRPVKKKRVNTSPSKSKNSAGKDKSSLCQGTKTFGKSGRSKDSKRFGQKARNFSLRDKPKKDYKELLAGKETVIKKNIETIETQKQTSSKLLAKDKPKQDKGQDDLKVKRKVPPTTVEIDITTTENNAIKKPDNSKIQLHKDTSTDGEIIYVDTNKYFGNRMITRRHSITTIVSPVEDHQGELSLGENESIEEFQRRTESVKLAHKKFSGKPYECDFNFEEDGPLASKSGSRKQYDNRVKEGKAMESTTAGVKKVMKSGSLSEVSKVIDDRAGKGRHNLRHSKEGAMREGTLSPMTVKLVSSNSSSKSETSDPIFSPHIFTCDNVKKYTRKLSTESERQSKPSPAATPVSVVSSENRKRSSIHKLESKTQVAVTTGANESEDNINKKNAVSKVRALRELHKSDKPFEWESGSPVRETRSSIKREQTDEKVPITHTRDNACKDEVSPIRDTRSRSRNSSAQSGSEEPVVHLQKKKELKKVKPKISLTYETFREHEKPTGSKSKPRKESVATKMPLPKDGQRISHVSIGTVTTANENENQVQHVTMEEQELQDQNRNRVTSPSKSRRSVDRLKSNEVRKTLTAGLKPNLSKVGPSKSEDLRVKDTNPKRKATDQMKGKKLNKISQSSKIIRSRSRSRSQDKSLISKLENKKNPREKMVSKSDKRKFSDTAKTKIVAKKQNASKVKDELKCHPKSKVTSPSGKKAKLRRSKSPVKARVVSQTEAQIDSSKSVKCKLDGTTNSPTNSPVKGTSTEGHQICGHIESQEECMECGPSSGLLKGQKYVYDSKRAPVRQIIHKGKVFEIQKGLVTESDIQWKKLSEKSESREISPVRSITSPSKSLGNNMGLRTRSSTSTDTGNPSTSRLRKRTHSPDSDINEKNVISSRKINSYISETLKRIGIERQLTTPQKWTVQKKTSVKGPKFPYSFKKSRKN